MVVARICARAYLFGRLSLWFAYLFGPLILWDICVGELPVVVRVDVARGTRGIVVWVNVVRVLLSFFWISSRLRESCLYAGHAHGVWFPFFPFSLTQPLVFYPIPSLANRTFFSCKSDPRSPSRVSRVSVDYLTDSETQPRHFIVDDGGFAPVISEPVIFAPGIYISCTRYLPTLHPSTLGPPAPTSTVTLCTMTAKDWTKRQQEAPQF
jgi:hypothetical protein